MTRLFPPTASLAPAALLAPAVLLALPACAPPPSAFDPVRVEAQAARSTSAAVYVGSFAGVSDAAGRRLRTALMASLARTGVTVLRRRSPADALELTGRISALNEGNTTAYAYELYLVDGSGERVAKLSGVERAAGGGAARLADISSGALANLSHKVSRKVVLALSRTF